MQHPDNIVAARLRHKLREGLARNSAGTGALMARATATRHRDLEQLLQFAAVRRLARAGGTTFRLGEPVPADREPANNDAGVASDAPTPAPRDEQSGEAAPRLLERIDVTDDLLRLFLARPPGFSYQPGQHVKMGLPGLLRNYSLVSAPHQTHLEFFVELYPGGRLSQRLRTVQPGTTMALGSRAKGELHTDARYPNQLLIATVTGIAPYVSFVRDHLHRFGSDIARRFIILHGASHADELGYAEELIGLARQHPRTITYVPTVSRPQDPRNAGWSGARGRVENQLAALLPLLGLTAADTAVFACGNPGMVSNVAADFRGSGFTTSTEPFD
jgi:ferredoxin-NADP reductase